jgi:hypothetical protein
MRSNGGRKLGSPGRRTPDTRTQLFVFVASWLWNHLASLVNATPSGRRFLQNARFLTNHNQRNQSTKSFMRRFQISSVPFSPFVIMTKPVFLRTDIAASE